MYKSAFQRLKRTFILVLRSSSSIFWFKKKPTNKIIGFLNQIMVGKTWDMHKRALQSLKRTFMHVSGLYPPCFGSKTNYFSNCFFFKSKYGGGKNWDMHKRAFQPWNARVCVSQVFFQHILIFKKPTYKIIGFFNQVMVGEVLRHA